MKWLQQRLERFVPNAGYYGWTIVVVGMFCSALSAPGQSFALSLYIEHLIADVGFTRVGLSSLYAAATLSAALGLPMLGALADRTSARKFIVTILLGMAAAMLLLSQATGVVTVAIALVALRLLGQGAIGLGTLTVTVRWFLRYRGRALAIVALGYALGELVFPGIIVALTSWLGWRGSLIALAALYVIVAAPLVARYMRERLPEDLPIDGAPLDTTSAQTTPVGADRDYSLRAALRTGTFWGMLLVVSVSPMLLTAVIFHQVALFEMRGWSAALIPTAFAAYAIAGVTITYAAGVILESVPVRFGVTASLLFAVAGLMWYEWGGGGLGGAVMYGTLLGTSSAIAGATNSLVWPEYFGIRALGALKGVVNAVRNGATAVGPVLVALLASVGSFSAGLLTLGVIAGVGAVAAVFIVPPPATDEDLEPTAVGRAA